MMTDFSSVQHIPEVYECFTELTSLFTSLVKYATELCTRIKTLSAIIHLTLVLHSQTPLTSQLNNLIKPILHQVKSEPYEFIQKLSSKYLVHLLDILFANNKVKAAQQILGLMIKSFETSTSNEPVSDRGGAMVLKEMSKKH